MNSSASASTSWPAPPSAAPRARRGRPLGSYEVSDFAGLAAAMAERPVQVLDARRDDERASGGVRGSQHIPIHELAERIDEVPDGEVWVYCGSGYRASIAASMLARTGRTPCSSTRATTTHERRRRRRPARTGLTVCASSGAGCSPADPAWTPGLDHGGSAGPRSGVTCAPRPCCTGRPTQQAVRVPLSVPGLPGPPARARRARGGAAGQAGADDPGGARAVRRLPVRAQVGRLPAGRRPQRASTRVWSKQGRDLTDRFPDVVAAARAQVPAGTVLDGEVVIWNGSRLDFGMLQERMVTSAAGSPRSSPRTRRPTSPSTCSPPAAPTSATSGCPAAAPRWRSSPSAGSPRCSSPPPPPTRRRRGAGSTTSARPASRAWSPRARPPGTPPAAGSG